MSKKIEALLIPFDETQEPRVVELRPGNLEDIYQHVAPDSRMFEVTRGKTIELWGDEEGGPMMRADAGERINARAMQLFAHDWSVGIDAFMTPLCGDFLAVGGLQFSGRNADVPQWVRDFTFSWSTHRPAGAI